MIAALVYLVVYIIIIGVIMWLLRYLVANLPMDAAFRQVANVCFGDCNHNDFSCSSRFFNRDRFRACLFSQFCQGLGSS